MGVTINIVNGSGRRAPGQDHISALVCGAVDVSGTGMFDVGTRYELNSLKQAEDIGINEAYDLAEGVLVWQHIKNFFDRCPGGTLHLLGVAQGTDLAEMADKTLTYAKKVINETNGAVRQIGFVLNPDMGTYTPTLTGGLDADVLAAIPKAQALALEAQGDKRPIVCLIEGREVNGTIGSITDLRTKAAPNVGVVIAQDPAVAALDAAFADYADVGTALGIMAQVRVNQSIGNRELAVCQLQTPEAYATAAISSGATVESLGLPVVDAIIAKGYIIPQAVQGLAGYFFGGSPSNNVATSDFAYLEDQRAINKVIRLANAYYATKVNSDVLLNDDGTLQGQEVGDLEAGGLNALQPMIEDKEISNANVFIDPTQDVGATDTVTVQIGITRVGVARTIVINLGYGLINTSV